MTAKITQLFEHTTQDAALNGRRASGWSESWYYDGVIGDATLNTRINRLCVRRAALLPASARIVGIRQGQVNPTSGSQSKDVVYPGVANSVQDLPQLALQFTMRSTAGFNQRNVELRGVPDNVVVRGEYVSLADYQTSLRAYFDSLRNDGWLMRAIDRTVLRVNIITITAEGVLTTQENHGLLAGNKISVMSTIDDDEGDKWSFEATCLTPTNATTVPLLLPYDFRGFGYHKGKIRKLGIDYVGVTISDDEILTPKAVMRKAGRPFAQFHGRRTARR